ncbi:MAG: hypothetical protein RL595_2555 [Planctomycetota bacterium]
MGAKIFISGSGPEHLAAKLEDRLDAWLNGRARVVFAGGGEDGWDVVLAQGDGYDHDVFISDLTVYLKKSPPFSEANIRWSKAANVPDSQ